MDDGYRLQRSLPSTLRLNLQQYMLRDFLGYNLHPSIDVHKDNVKIADVGTGTGIWLSHLTRELPPSAQLDGFDVSPAQFPHSNSLAKNVHLLVGDASQSPPKHLCGQYDVVHVRLFKPVVTDNEPGPFIEHVKALLKPGGYVMWTELDQTLTRACVGDSEADPGQIDLVMRELRADGEEWIPELPKFFSEHGLEPVATDRRREPPWQRQMNLESMCFVVQEKAAMKTQRGRKPQDYLTEMQNAVQHTLAASRKGLYFELVAQVVVGRKPEVP